MNPIEQTLFLLFAAFWIVLFAVYHYMIYAVNKHLPEASRIPHVRISQNGLWGSHGFEWKAVLREYKKIYPSGFANTASVICLVSIVAIAIAFVVLRSWEYTHGQLP